MQVLSTIGVSLVCLVLLTFCSLSQSSCATICFADVHRALSNNTLIIDVRPRQEVLESGLIPSSINIPLCNVAEQMGLTKSEFKSEYSHAKPRKRDLIIVTGRPNMRHMDAVESLLAIGYTKVKDYIGGYDDWEKQIGCLPPPQPCPSQHDECPPKRPACPPPVCPPPVDEPEDTCP